MNSKFSQTQARKTEKVLDILIFLKVRTTSKIGSVFLLVLHTTVVCLGVFRHFIVLCTCCNKTIFGKLMIE